MPRNCSTCRPAGEPRRARARSDTYRTAPAAGRFAARASRSSSRGSISEHGELERPAVLDALTVAAHHVWRVREFVPGRGRSPAGRLLRGMRGRTAPSVSIAYFGFTIGGNGGPDGSRNWGYFCCGGWRANGTRSVPATGNGTSTTWLIGLAQGRGSANLFSVTAGATRQEPRIPGVVNGRSG